ncbi:MAG: GNAT family N-acetyltransferase [Actinomycetota bacterium]|nr:GNAT family N-acetyltransferase [Actinomycetota bacterium]
MDRGTMLIARSGPVVGCVRLDEVETRQVVVDDLVVKQEKRGQGLGTQLLQAAMNNKGGTLYLRCTASETKFFGRLGFTEVRSDDLPEAIRNYMNENADAPGDTYLKAR